MGVATMSTDNATPLVTICPPHRRSKDIARREPFVGGPPVTTATALQWPVAASSVPTSKDDRRTAQQRIEAAQRSVVASQPHRRWLLALGLDPADPIFGTELGRFCGVRWPKDRGTMLTRIGAGSDYAKEVREANSARGFLVRGLECVQKGRGGTDDMSPDEIEKARDDVLKAERAVRRANEELIGVDPRLPNAMVSLCVEDDPPKPNHEDILVNGLYRLALHYGKIDLGINKLRAY